MWGMGRASLLDPGLVGGQAVTLTRLGVKFNVTFTIRKSISTSGRAALSSPGQPLLKLFLFPPSFQPDLVRKGHPAPLSLHHKSGDARITASSRQRGTQQHGTNAERTIGRVAA